MLSKAQQSGIGIVSINAGFGGFATAGADRITPAGIEVDGAAGVNLTVAFIGVSGVGAIRAVSLRGASDPVRFSIGDTGPPGFSGESGRAGAGGFTEGAAGCTPGVDAGAGTTLFALKGDGGAGIEGALKVEAGVGMRAVEFAAVDGVGNEGAGNGVGGFAAEGGGGRGGLGAKVGDGGPFASVFALGGETVGLPGGRTMFGETDAGGRIIGGAGGRRTGAPLGGSTGLGATRGGGGKTRGGTDALEVVPVVGGRTGKLIRVVSFATGTVGRCVGRGGRVIRTVSFFGSFRSAISL
jgi:hypothetical protein